METGTKSRDWSSYKLPVVDVDVEKRNFPGYGKDQYFSLDEIRQGDMAGTTDTDSVTGEGAEYPEADYEKGYSSINKEKNWPKGRDYATQMPHVKDN